MKGVVGSRENGIYPLSSMKREISESNEGIYPIEGSRWIDVINHICQIDKNVAKTLSMGYWETVVSKHSFLCMVNRQLWKTFIVWKQRIKTDRKSSTITYRYLILHDVYDAQKAIDFYRKVMAKDVVFAHNKVNVKKFNRRIDDNYRLKVNREKQLWIQQKIQELKEEYEQIKRKRAKFYKERKEKIRQLIPQYEKLLEELKKAEKELMRKIKEKQNVKSVKLV